VAKRNRQLQRYRELLANLLVQLLEVPEDVLRSVHLGCDLPVDGHCGAAPSGA